MKKIIFYSVCFSWMFFFFYSFAQDVKQLKEDMIGNLDFIKRTMQVQYAPLDWKKQSMNWSIEDEFEKAINQILDLNALSSKNYRQIIKEFLGTAQDYHVQITFFSTESSFLPFSVKTIEGKCFVDWIDNDNWPVDQPRLSPGDEILFFAGRHVDEVIDEIKAESGRKANTPTDQALADHSLTLRLGSAGNTCPKGNIEIIAKTAKEEVLDLGLSWFYQPERIANPLNLNFLFKMLASLEPKNSFEDKLKMLLQKRVMINPLHRLQIQERELRHGELGASRSALPFLGHPVWTYQSKIPNQENEGPRNSNGEIRQEKRIRWFAYIYKNEEGKSIGYLRIPHYSGDEEDFFNCIPIISYLENHTDVLVLDQLNNPGGYVNFMNRFLSLITPHPLKIPKHQVAINQKEVMEAIQQIDELNDYVTFNLDKNSGLYQNYQQIIDYYHFILEEWNGGKTLTSPVYLEGVETIQPYRVHYSKPILMLINESDFSAGDFAPAILSDNKRVILMGEKTAGAGGAVSTFSFPNRYGIKEISFTDTIAERENSQKIENLGVMPDIEYRVSEEDLHNGYQNYKDAINQAVKEILEN